MQTVAIIGTGLIGSSFGLALRKAGFGGRIFGVSSEAALRDAVACGAIDEGRTLEEAIPEADLVYLSQTIQRIIAGFPALAALVRPGALVTDAGSTKSAIVEAARVLAGKAQFLGAHPMAGKEKRGAAAADADLFRGRTYLLTPSDAAELETLAALEFVEWIGKIGAVPVVLSAAEHDRVVALTSHMPQLVSTALAATLGDELDKPEHLLAAGPGLMDMTRLADSAYDIWADILATNPAAIDSALSACIEQLTALRAGLTSEGTKGTFEKGAEFRARLKKR